MWNQDNQSFAGTIPIDAQHTDGGRGWLGRVGGGCDYQFWQKFVIGALADYDFASLKSNMTAPFATISGDEKMNWAWAAGGRLGYLPWNTLLVYISGDYTQAHFDGTLFIQGVSPSTLSTLGQTYSGWFLGSGYEYRFDWLPACTGLSLQQLQQQRHPASQRRPANWRLYSCREVRPNGHLVTGLALQLWP